MIRKLLLISLLIGMTTLLLACHNKEKTIPLKKTLYEVSYEPIHKQLFFTGTIQPLYESAITCPMDAVIESMDFQYGELITQNNVVITLNSTDLQKQYNDTLTDYLKAKDSFSVAKAKFVGTKNLWEAGLLSKNNYLGEKSSLDTARVTLMQALHKLTDMSEKTDNNESLNATNLNISDFDQVKQELTRKHNLIHLKAPASGVLLYPPKSGEDKTSRLSIGSSVKAGQVIALIGDLTGISVEIDVPEIDIGKIHPGMKALITGVALGKEPIVGKLINVNAQASSASGNSLPSFHALVRVSRLTKAQQAWIKVGMSAAIELTVEEESHIMIPIAAIKYEKGLSVVEVQANNGSTSLRRIITGVALADKVVVLSGLTRGEKIIYVG